jgi:dTDP-4-dehydrorhamnose 3,5-epimerase
MDQPKIITGDLHADARGTVRFINDFNMSLVVRLYSIEPAPGTIRAWQGHREETKWFYVTRGSLIVKTLNMFNHLRSVFILNDAKPAVLEIPGGHYTGFVSDVTGAVLMVFSDCSVAQSMNDDYRESMERFPWNE